MEYLELWANHIQQMENKLLEDVAGEMIKLNCERQYEVEQ